MNTSTDLAKLELRTLWAEPMGGRLYRVDNSPCYGYGVSWNGMVEGVQAWYRTRP